MNRGYVKLWRKSLDSGLLQNPEAWALWSYILMSVTHKPTKQLVGNQMVNLEPGQMVTGRYALAKALKLTPKVTRTRLLLLENLGNVAIKRANKFSIITVVNWDAYQANITDEGQQTGQQRANKGPAEGQQRATNKNIRTEEHKNDLVPSYEGTCPQGSACEPESSLLTPQGQEKKVAKKDNCPHQAIVDLYHEILEQPRVVKWTEKRQKHLLAHWRAEPKHRSLDWWRNYFERVRDTPFMRGVNDRGWFADLEFLVKQGNAVKFFEGKYDR